MSIDWNAPRYLDLPDLRMAVFEAGAPRDDRPSVVLCHGFPEIAYSWREIVPPLVEAGFHVIAPDQRGYGHTGAAASDKGDAESVALYDMPHLTGDLAAMLDALGVEQAVFAGHDWGGIVIWQLPFYHSARVAGLVGVNTPFIPRLQMKPIDAMRAAMGDDMYIVAFQEFGHAEAQMEADVGHALRCFYRKSGSIDSADKTPPGAEWENFKLLKILAMGEESWPGEVLFPPDVFAHYEAAFTRSGFRAPINWYRNFNRNWELAADFEQKIDVPSLMICAADDRVLPPSMAEGMPKYVGDLETHIIENCGHWTQNEQPEKLAGHMTDWLTRRFT